MKKIIGVIGPSSDLCSKEAYSYAVTLGKYLVDKGFVIVCGGKYGVMEAVCKGACESMNYQFGCTIGIIPEDNKTHANKYCDIVIPSGLGISRNMLIINTSDLLIALGGGAGTLSEIAFAWQKNKTVLCSTKFDGWALKLAGKNLDERKSDLLISFDNIAEIESVIQKSLS